MSKYSLNTQVMPISEIKDFVWLEQNYTQLANWLSDMCSLYVAKSLCEIKTYGDSVHVNLYSKTNIYHICANIQDDIGYLGLTHSNRESGAGNDWTDGNYSKETFDKIMKDIFSLEILPLDYRDE